MFGHAMNVRGMGEKQMTNEEARMNLKKLLQIYDDPGIIDFTVIVESIKMALEALRNAAELISWLDECISDERTTPIERATLTAVKCKVEGEG